MPEGQEFVAVILLLLFMVAGVAIMFNLVPAFAVGGDISLGGINGFTDGFWKIMLRFVISPALIILPGYVIWNIFRQ